MDTRPVFVLVTAKTCGYCKSFKRDIWSGLEAELKQGGKVRIVEVELATTRDVPSTTAYPPDLGRFVGWFPTFLLIDGNSWNSRGHLEGLVFNGIAEGERFKIAPRTTEVTKENILTWTNTNAAQLNRGQAGNGHGQTIVPTKKTAEVCGYNVYPKYS